MDRPTDLLLLHKGGSVDDVLVLRVLPLPFEKLIWVQIDLASNIILIVLVLFLRLVIRPLFSLALFFLM